MNHRKAHALGNMLRSNASPPSPPPSLVSPERPLVAKSTPVIRIIDWTAVAWATFEFLFAGILGLAELGSRAGLSAILLPGAFISLIVIIQKLAGVTFDTNHGILRFYSFWLPKTLDLADIRDANCEFAITLSPSRVAIGICGSSQSGQRHGRGAATQRTYMVNLSGSFGSRQVRFYSKRWRDSFLSVLREQAPRCRITRWH